MNRDLDLIRSQGEGNSSPNTTRAAGNQGMLFIGRHNEISFPNRSSVLFMIHKSQFTKTMTWKRLFVYLSRCSNIILPPFSGLLNPKRFGRIQSGRAASWKPRGHDGD